MGPGSRVLEDQAPESSTSEQGLFLPAWTGLLPVRTWSSWWQWARVSRLALAAGVVWMLQLAWGSRQHLATA